MSKETIVSCSIEEIRDRIARGEARSDWERVDATTDEEIEAQLRDDPDWAEFLDIDWSKAKVVLPAPKEAISIRLDRDVLDFFKSTGKGYQTRINAILRRYMEEKVKSRITG